MYLSSKQSDTGISKLLTMNEAVSRYVRDGMLVAIEGFTSHICFAAGHEIIRQGRRDLTLARMTPDVIYDQMVAAGVARKLIFSYMGNPGVGSLHCLRRAIEDGVPHTLEIEEYSHYGMVCRYTAAASGLPFFPLRSYLGSDMPVVNPLIRSVESPYGDGPVSVVPPLNPDVAILQVQRADNSGNCHLWGLLGVQKEVAFAARSLIVVAEEIVSENIIRADPNRTLIPGLIVDAVVHEPFGAHPSYMQGYYDRDNAFYVRWEELSRDAGRTEDWLREWVYGVSNRAEYLAKLGEDNLRALIPGVALAPPVDYSEYK